MGKDSFINWRIIIENALTVFPIISPNKSSLLRCFLILKWYLEFLHADYSLVIIKEKPNRKGINMELNKDEKRVLNTLFTGLRGTTRNEMLMTLYAAKPEADGSVDSQFIHEIINGLIVKIYNADRSEMEEVFAGIPYDIE